MTDTTLTRPNGKPYRPRKPGLRTRPWGNDDTDRHGVVVLGTLDPEEAHPQAAEWIMYWHDTECRPAHPEPGWYRDGYDHTGPAWIIDEKRGAPGVMFTCEDS